MKNIVINGKEYSPETLGLYLYCHAVIECRGFQYGGHDGQLYDIDYLVEEIDGEYDEQDAAKCLEDRGYGCCYVSSWEYLAEEMGVSVNEVIANYIDGKHLAKTCGRDSEGEYPEATTPLVWC